MIEKSLSKGIYIVGDKRYQVEILSGSKEDLYNFYIIDDKGKELTTSIYTKYHSKASGVKNAGDFTREVYGNYDVYASFRNNLEKVRGIPKQSKGFESRRDLELSDEGYFVDILEKKSDYIYHKQQIAEGVVLQEELEVKDENTGELLVYIEYKVEDSNYTKRVTKIKGLEYTLRDSGKGDYGYAPVRSLDELSLEYDLDWLFEGEYKLISHIDELVKFLEDIKDVDVNLAFSTINTGDMINRLPLDHPERDNLVGISMSVEEGTGIYIPLSHKSVPNLDVYEVIWTLKPYIDRDGEYKKAVLTHFDRGMDRTWSCMYGYGIDLNIINDTFILEYILNNTKHYRRNSLEAVVKDYFGVDMVYYEDLFNQGKRAKSKYIKDFSLVHEESARLFGASRADMILRLFNKNIKDLSSNAQFLYFIEIELLRYISHMEYHGIKLDLDYLNELKEEAEEQKAELEAELFELAGEEFKPTSTKDVPRIMYDKLKYPILQYTAKGNPSTGKLVLDMLGKEKNEDGSPKYPFAIKMKEYKAVTKLLNGFVDKMLKDNIDGYIFPNYDQAGTASGRVSCSKPNLQQSPGRQRNAFIPDSDDYYFVIVDYSQVEYRIMAGLANEVDVVEQFADPEADFHTNMYARMHGKDPDEVSAAERSIGKVLNFGLTYGMGDRSLALTLYKDDSPSKVAEAGRLANLYWSSVPRIRDMLAEARDRAYLQGYIETTFGRRRYLPEIRSSNYAIREKNLRRAANTKVQGTGADILKISHVKVHREIERRGLDAMVKISMHDELVVQAHKDINPWEMIKLLRENMELNIPNFPPLYIGANVGESWAAGKRDDLEVPILLAEKMIAEGEHLKPGVRNPEEYVENQIKEYMIEYVMSIIEQRGFTTVEEALDYAKLSKILKDYFGGFDAEELVQDILDNKDIDLGSGIVVYNDLDLEYEDGEVDSDEVDISKVDFKALKGEDEEVPLEEKKKKLKVDDEIGSTAEVLGDYRVLLYDMTYYISLDGCSKKAMLDIVEYLKTVAVDSFGYRVAFRNRGKIYNTELRVSELDRIKVIGILEEG